MNGSYGLSLGDAPLAMRSGRVAWARSDDGPGFASKMLVCTLNSAGTISARRIDYTSSDGAPVDIEILLQGRGGGAVEGAVGLPSIVFASISSMRVPSGSNKFACRFRLTPVCILISRGYCWRAGRASSVSIAFCKSGTTRQM